MLNYRQVMMFLCMFSEIINREYCALTYFINKVSPDKAYLFVAVKDKVDILLEKH